MRNIINTRSAPVKKKKSVILVEAEAAHIIQARTSAPTGYVDEIQTAGNQRKTLNIHEKHISLFPKIN